MFARILILCLLVSLPTALLADAPATQPAGQHTSVLDIRPTARKKVSPDDAERDRMKKEWDQYIASPAEKISASPLAADFPGAVPADAPRVSRDVEINQAQSGWQSTGLYAPPGEMITFTLSELPKDASVRARIGAHKDELWRIKGAWSRFPEITIEKKFNTATLKLNNPFGGLVYVHVNIPAKAKKIITARISGAVEAPLFVLGKTSSKDWQEKIRNLPGPWCEWATEKLILTVPSADARKIDDPTAVMKVWDQYLDACSDLTGRSHERARPERMVFDRQISAGWLHSGYPIMGHLASVEEVIVLEKVKNVPWGPVHELGHNHQQGAWTTPFNGEVSCNFFPIFIRQQLNHQNFGGHPALTEESLKKSLGKLFANPPEKREGGPFEHLYMYAEIAREFGWDKFTEIWKQYDKDPPRGKLDEKAKNTEWARRMSKLLGKNLLPYLKEWNFPANYDELKELNALAVWMPNGFPERFTRPAK